MKLVLYGTDCCQLCDEALTVIEEALTGRQYELDIVDISTLDELMEKYAYSIPVLQLDNQELNWPFDASDVHNFIKRVA